MEIPEDGGESMKTVAVRNLRLCTKDCICLYVCPTGATDTEDSVIDVKKCTGCGVCAGACPSSAISMVPLEYPVQQKHSESVLAAEDRLSKNKCQQEILAKKIASSADKDGLYRLMKAIEMSSRIMAEDVFRESGYMLPQSANSQNLLIDLIENGPESFPRDTARDILDAIPCNEPEDRKGLSVPMYKCGYCGTIFEHDGKRDIVCPLCKTSGESFKRL